MNTADTSFNGNGYTYAAWTFRRAKKFFDVVTWTGDNITGRQIPHSLGVVPGLIIVKQLNGTAAWYVYHRSVGSGQYLTLNSTSAVTTGALWNNTGPTDSYFALNGSSAVNASGNNYIAYLFAHDPDPDGVIQCGSYTGNGSGGQDINLGWEPQYLMVKPTTQTGNWQIIDNARGMSFATSKGLQPNLTNAEGEVAAVVPTATGFRLTGNTLNDNAVQFVYMAIRRGPMRVPTNPTKVFMPYTGTASALQLAVGRPYPASDYAPSDMFLARFDRNTTANTFVTDRLRGWSAGSSPLLKTNLTDAEASPTTNPYVWRQEAGASGTSAAQLWLGMASNPAVIYAFARAPGFFDTVCYSGNGVSPRQITHGLRATPTMIWVKNRTSAGKWFIYHRTLPTGVMYFDIAAFVDGSPAVTAPTDTTFEVRGNLSSSVNQSGQNYTAYLFGDVPGVSKAGSYTHTGTDLFVDCGFSPRFLLVKRADDAGGWFYFDTARGIVAAYDPILSLHTTTGEAASIDYIDPASGGFIVVAGTGIAVAGSTWIYYAIA